MYQVIIWIPGPKKYVGFCGYKSVDMDNERGDGDG